jgi:hypothetical protein
MVLPLAAAAAAQAGSAGATALGLGMGKTDLDLTRNLFKLQMRQAKRLWTADWAESSVRHGEACMQSAQQHAESQAMAMATYYQAEKLARQGIKLARDQDSRNYEMAWRAEVRESLRDELANQFNRFNIVMLCDTVCLSCVFSLVAAGNTVPEGTTVLMMNMYVLCMGVSITLFSISLWFAVIVVRRLHEHTAATLERKLFEMSEDLRKAWGRQLSQNLPTGPNEIYLVNQEYEKWVAQYLDPIGDPSIHMMAVGVVMMFTTAGLLTHNKYLIEHNSVLAVSIFWSMVFITSTTVIVMKYAEDRKERKKEGVYDNSWQDQNTTVESGPFAKICRASEELFSVAAMELANTDRMETLGGQELSEREFCAKTQYLHQRVESLRKEAEQRTKTRKDVLRILTTAAEELDALPEELTSQLNKLLHTIDEADSRTADLVTMNTIADNMAGNGVTRPRGWSYGMASRTRQPMSPCPIDAQMLPVSLVALRKKLGESSLTTLLRFKNLSDEPLRLKSGVQLKDGKYFERMKTIDPNNSTLCYHLYPGTEIPPRSELVVAARNNTGWGGLTSGIEGEIVYTNRDESWVFRIKFSNQRVPIKVRKCKVLATYVGDTGGEAEEHFWTISKTELDIKQNNEILIAMDVLLGEQGKRAALSHRKAQVTLKSGLLLKNKIFGLGLQWKQKWVVLTPTDILYSENVTSQEQRSIALKDVASVRKGTDMVKRNVFEIRTHGEGKSPYKFSAASAEEQEDWIQNLLDATGIILTDVKAREKLINNTRSCETAQSVIEDGIECVMGPTGFSIRDPSYAEGP